VPIHGIAPAFLSYMNASISRLTAETVGYEIQAYIAERQTKLLPSGEGSKDGRRFSWCGEILDFLAEGLVERFAARGITFADSFPGPVRLMDEDQHPDGQHVRRFGRSPCTTAAPSPGSAPIFFIGMTK
jgi:hypothetical protein